MLDVAQENVRRKKSQALVGVSMESAPNYPLLSDKAFLARFDILATLVLPERTRGKPPLHWDLLPGACGTPTMTTCFGGAGRQRRTLL